MSALFAVLNGAYKLLSAYVSFCKKRILLYLDNGCIGCKHWGHLPNAFLYNLYLVI